MVSKPDVTLMRLPSTTSELCQASLTQGQVAQRRFMVASWVRILESGRLRVGLELGTLDLSSPYDTIVLC